MESVTEAIHMNNGDQHIVGFKALRVLLSKEDASWFAQGLEIDYASAGASIEEAKRNFETGFQKTISEHLKLNGSIEKMLKIAPQYAWDEFYAARFLDLKQEYTTLQFHDLGSIQNQPSTDATAFPFAGIEFLEPLAA